MSFLQTYSNELFSAVFGFLFGLFSKFVYDWNLDRRERRTIRLSLLMEVLYVHKSSLKHTLFMYQEAFEKNRIRGLDLGGGFSRPYFSTKIYENHITKIDRLFGSELSLQLHYYYLLIESLNECRSQPKDLIDEDYIKDYLNNAAHTFAMMTGAVDVLLDDKKAKKTLRRSVQGILNDCFDLSVRKVDAEILSSYGQKGAADDMKMPPPRRPKGLLWNGWF